MRKTGGGGDGRGGQQLRVVSRVLVLNDSSMIPISISAKGMSKGQARVFPVYPPAPEDSCPAHVASSGLWGSKSPQTCPVTGPLLAGTVLPKNMRPACGL